MALPELALASQNLVGAAHFYHVFKIMYHVCMYHAPQKKTDSSK